MSTTNDMAQARLLSKKDVCQVIGASTRWLVYAMQDGRFPPPDCHLGNRPRWRTSTILNWIASKCGEAA